MTYRVALLALTSASLLAGPLGGLAETLEGDRRSLLAQAPRLTEPPASTETSPSGETLDLDATDPQATPTESGASNQTSLPSAEVKTLQQQLARLGYYSGAVDGVFGTETSEAVSRFQRDVGLATTGLPDPLTLKQLQAAENPLGIVPETPSAETDATPSEATDVTTAPEGAAPASTPLDGTAEPTAPPLEAANPSANEANNTENSAGGRGLIRLVLVGMMIAVMGIAAAVAFLFLRRRPAASHDVESDLAVDGAAPDVPMIDTVPAVSAPTQPAPAPAPPIAPLPIADVPRNGHHSTPETPPLPAAQSSALAAETTTKLVPVNIIDELVQDLQNPDPAQRRKAIWELGQRGNSTAVQPLARLMLDADSKERSLILAALAEISTQTLKPMNRALALSLQDENPEVRKNAIRDMTRIYALMGQAGTMLNHAATDSDPEVRQTASWAMEQLERMRSKAINPDVPSLTGHNGSET